MGRKAAGDYCEDPNECKSKICSIDDDSTDINLSKESQPLTDKNKNNNELVLADN